MRGKEPTEPGQRLRSGQCGRLCAKLGLGGPGMTWIGRVLSLLVALALAACGQPEVQPLAFGPAPWQDGELSTYRLTAVDGSFAGTAQISLDRLEEGWWRMRREILAQGDQELVEVEASDKGLRPRRSLLTRSSPDGQERVEATYVDGQVDMTLTTKQDVTTYERAHIPSDAREQRTLPMLVRMLPLDAGYATRLNTYLPVSALLDRVTVQVVKPETVDVPAGRFDTWLVTFDTGDSESQAWYSQAAPHQLVKFVDGRSGGLYELASYEPGK